MLYLFCCHKLQNVVPEIYVNVQIARLYDKRAASCKYLRKKRHGKNNIHPQDLSSSGNKAKK